MSRIQVQLNLMPGIQATENIGGCICRQTLVKIHQKSLPHREHLCISAQYSLLCAYTRGRSMVGRAPSMKYVKEGTVIVP